MYCLQRRSVKRQAQYSQVLTPPFSLLLRSLISSSFLRHVGLDKRALQRKEREKEWRSDHEIALEKHKAVSASKKLAADALESEPWQVGEGAQQLDLATKEVRLRLLTTLLKSARPLRVADDLREFMETPGVQKLTTSSHLLALLPIVEKLEFAKIVTEFSTGFTSSIFDGAGHHGDMLCNLLRKTQNFQIIQRLAGLRHSDAVFDHETLNQCIIDLTTDIGLMKSRGRVKAFCHDAASVNLLAASQMKNLFYDLFDMVCASHIMQRVGERFEAPLVDKLITAWFKLFKNGTNRIYLWRQITGISFPSYNPIKWHSRFQLAKFIMENFLSLKRFLVDDRLAKMVKDVKKRSKTVVVLESLVQDKELMVQLAAYVDFSSELVNSTYAIEGDGPVALVAATYVGLAFLKIRSYSSSPDPTEGAPNLRSVLHVVDRDTIPDLLVKLRAIVTPAFKYFERQKAKHPEFFRFLEIAKCFCPWSAADLTDDSLRFLFSLKVFNYEELTACLTELPAYKALAASSPLSGDPTVSLAFRNRTGTKNNLPEWKVWRWWFQTTDQNVKTLRSVAERLGLYQPTSAAAERVFSLFRHHIKANMATASADYLKWQAILNYNATVSPMAEIVLTAPL